MIVELRNVYKNYTQGKMDVPVLRNINFGIEEGEYYIPSLTTIRQPLDEIATEGIKSLFEMINETGTSRNIIMPAELVVRESTGPVSG